MGASRSGYKKAATPSTRPACRSLEEVGGAALLLTSLDREGAAIVDTCLKEGLLINNTAGKVLRFIPPLIVTKAEIDEGLAIVEKVLAQQ